MGSPFAVVQLRDQHAADAMPEGIARGEHDGRPAAAGKHVRCIERHRPGFAATFDRSKLEVPCATEHHLGFCKRVSACLGQPGKAIFADADNAQPGTG